MAPLFWNVARNLAVDNARHQCEECESKVALEVHHIIPLDKYEIRWKNEKNRQDNLKVLCRDCHEKAHHPNAGIPLANRVPKEQLAMVL